MTMNADHPMIVAIEKIAKHAGGVAGACERAGQREMEAQADRFRELVARAQLWIVHADSTNAPVPAALESRLSELGVAADLLGGLAEMVDVLIDEDRLEDIVQLRGVLADLVGYADRTIAAIPRPS